MIDIITYKTKEFINEKSWKICDDERRLQQVLMIFETLRLLRGNKNSGVVGQ